MGPPNAHPRNPTPPSPPSSAGGVARPRTPQYRFFSVDVDGPPHHFLDSCFLCRKPLDSNRDIFMYRGDTPFCSEECRLVKIEMGEGAEQRRRHSLKASSSTDSNKAGIAASPSKSHEAHARTGTVVAAG